MRRVLRWAARTGALALAIAAMTVWARSHFHCDRHGYLNDGVGASVMSYQGLVVLRAYRYDPRWSRLEEPNVGMTFELNDLWAFKGDYIQLHTDPLVDPRVDPVDWWNRLGFEFAGTAFGKPAPSEPATLTIQRVTLPHWFVTLLATFIAAALWRRPVRERFRAWRRPGACPGCGYDLRASPDRCPECGRKVQKSSPLPSSVSPS